MKAVTQVIMLISYILLFWYAPKLAARPYWNEVSYRHGVALVYLLVFIPLAYVGLLGVRWYYDWREEYAKRQQSSSN